MSKKVGSIVNINDDYKAAMHAKTSLEQIGIDIPKEVLEKIETTQNMIMECVMHPTWISTLRNANKENLRICAKLESEEEIPKDELLRMLKSVQGKLNVLYHGYRGDSPAETVSKKVDKKTSKKAANQHKNTEAKQTPEIITESLKEDNTEEGGELNVESLLEDVLKDED